MKGIIYKIVIDDKVYVGSTKTSLSQRQAHHNCRLRNGKTLKIYNYARQKGVEKIICVGIETFEYNELWELRKREEEHRIQEQNCLNSLRCYVSEKEKKEKEQERLKIWREENKDKISASQKKWCKENKEKIAEIHKKWREENKDKILEKARKRYEENIEKEHERSKKYYEENRDDINRKRRERRAKKKLENQKQN